MHCSVTIKKNNLQGGVNVAYGNGRVPSDAWDIARQIAGWISPQQ